MLQLMAGDGAQLPRNLLSAPEYSIVSLVVCGGCPTRYAVTLIPNGLILREIGGWGRWACSQDVTMQVVCAKCLGTLSVYVLNAAETADGRHVALSEAMSERYQVN